MKMEKMAVMLVMVVELLAVVHGLTSTPECMSSFLHYCRKVDGYINKTECCKFFKAKYHSDRKCLCTLMIDGNTTNAKMVDIVSSCNVDISSNTNICASQGGGKPGGGEPSGERSGGGKSGGGKPGGGKPSVGVVVGATLGSIFTLGVLILGIALFIRRRKVGPPSPQPPIAPPQPPIAPPVRSDYKQEPGPASIKAGLVPFTYEALEKATNGFSKDTILGKGAFGYVNRGTLPDGTQVAVKHMNPQAWNGEEQFWAELQVVGRVHHRHIVKLIGFCSMNDKKLLVFEFMPCGSLQSQLHESKMQTIFLDWKARMNIAIGSAKGLRYLHDECEYKIIHRDVKAANILIDSRFNAKIADFGFAKTVYEDATRITTKIVGTHGYLAPEYLKTGKLTYKSDVYSFGVVLLELITGQPPKHGDNCLVDVARPLLSQAMDEEIYNALIDKKLQNTYNLDEMARMVYCASLCIMDSPQDRPSMSKVVQILEGNSLIQRDLSQGISPGESLGRERKHIDTEGYTVSSSGTEYSGAIASDEFGRQSGFGGR